MVLGICFMIAHLDPLGNGRTLKLYLETFFANSFGPYERASTPYSLVVGELAAEKWISMYSQSGALLEPVLSRKGMVWEPIQEEYTYLVPSVPITFLLYS